MRGRNHGVRRDLRRDTDMEEAGARKGEAACGGQAYRQEGLVEHGAKRERREWKGSQTRETFCVYLRTSDKEESLSSDLGRAEN